MIGDGKDWLMRDSTRLRFQKKDVLAKWRMHVWVHQHAQSVLLLLLLEQFEW